MKKIIFLSFLFFTIALQSQTLYWVNKNGGNFNDAANWSDVSGGTGGVASPDATIDVVFDKYSGLEAGEVIHFLQGVDYHAKSILVEEFSGEFTFSFEGSSTNRTTLNIYGDFKIQENISIIYTNPGTFNNKIIFNGSGIDHFIFTLGQDLNHIEFLNPNAEYVQESDLYASSMIRMYGGQWNTQGHEVRTDGLLQFKDNQSSSNQYSKVFNTSGSNIYCQEYDAKFVYGSLDINGTHTIHTEVFDGNPSQSTVPTVYDELVLLSYEPGTFNPIEDNNLDCAGCNFQKVTISDNYVTRIGGGVQIQDLEILNIESEIQVNGGNSRPDVLDLGTMSTPGLGNCNLMPTITAIYTSGGPVVLNALSTNLTLTNVKLIDVSAGANGNYTLNAGILAGSSQGWNQVNLIPGNTFYWRNTNSNNLWDVWKNWANTLGVSGCLPTEIDDVVIDNNSPSNIIIPSSIDAKCKNLMWIKDNGLLNMEINDELEIYGSMNISKFATFNGTNSIDMAGIGQFQIESLSLLPRLDFRSAGSTFILETDLACDRLYFAGADFITNDFDIITNAWTVDNIDGNNFYLGSSNITVSGEVDLAANNGVDQIIDAGSSTITCETFKSRKSYNFYNLVLQNPTTFSFENFPFSFNNLQLEGSAPVQILGDMEINTLILTDGNADLEIVSGVELTVNNTITSSATSGSPASVSATSSTAQAIITKPSGNLCIDGFINIQDINASAEGIVHAPESNDIGNNSNIDFTGINFSSSAPLYWIGKTTNWATRSNWSTLSGGCSTNFNPNNRPQLIFDEHSQYDNDQVIIYASTTTNEILFHNMYPQFTLDNRVGLNLQNILLDGAALKLIGEDINLSGELSLNNSSFIEMKADVIRMPLLNNSSSLIVVRAPSQIIQEEN